MTINGIYGLNGIDSKAARLQCCRIMRILLADDHAAARSSMKELLETQRGWNVCGEASDGQEAIDKTRQLRPDIVILDISMPVLNGFAAAEAIKELCPDTAILVYSVYDPKAFLKEAKRLGVDGYVSKSEGRQAIVNQIAAIERGLSAAR